ncbi:MAG: hypothetical protein CXZ00_15845 [Acidobacteria bacterium]|nr:MAG: hypothetical protein CXZ00_15845 [Acidobacteriota bacterium]
MGWSFRRSKSFGLFKLNFSKSGVGFSFGVPGARIGINSKGKKYVRGGIPGTGMYYQSSLPDAQQLHPRENPPSSISPLGILIVVVVVGLIIIYAMSSSTPTTKSVPVAPLPQTVAPVAAPVAPKHVVKKYKRKHAAHRALVTAAKSDEVPAAESNDPDVNGEVVSSSQ